MKDFEIADIKKENIELKDLNKQYFKTIIRLIKNKEHLKIVCAFELCIIIILLGLYISL